MRATRSPTLKRRSSSCRRWRTPGSGAAGLLAARGELQRAIADFNRAIELKPDLARHYVLRGEAFASMGDNQRALTDFEQAIRLEPDNNPFAYHARGAIYRRTGNFDAAIASHDQGLRIHPVDPYGFASRAYAFSEKGDQNRALTDADEALRLNGNLGLCLPRARPDLQPQRQRRPRHRRLRPVDPAVAGCARLCLARPGP